MKESITKVYMAVHKQETELELLKIQARFIGNPPIFKTNRVLLFEGDLFRVTDKNEDKQYRFHLFSDALIYSRKLTSESYKFTRALKLSECSVNDLPDRLPDDLNSFEVVFQERKFKIRAHNKARSCEERSDELPT